MNELTRFRVEFSEFIERLRRMRRWDTITREVIDHGRRLEAGFWVQREDGMHGYVFRASYGRWPGPLSEEEWAKVKCIVDEEALMVQLRNLTGLTPRINVDRGPSWIVETGCAAEGEHPVP